MQMNNEWERKPLTDIQAINMTIVGAKQYACKPGYKEIFDRNWMGLDYGCQVGDKVISKRDHAK